MDSCHVVDAACRPKKSGGGRKRVVVVEHDYNTKQLVSSRLKYVILKKNIP
jgi:hypothetical protein